MYIQQLRLENIRCFDNQTLYFGNEAKPYPWTVILGENGTGKSTILQMLALSLLGRDLIHEIAGTIDWNQYVRKSAEKAYIDVVILATKTDKRRRSVKKGQSHDIYTASFELGPTKKIGLEQRRDKSPDDYDKLDETLYSNKIEIGWFACAYSAWRRLSTPKLPSRTSLSSIQLRKKSQRFVTMFDPEKAVTDVGDWLVSLEFQRLKEPNNPELNKSFNLAVHALETTLQGIKFKEITSNGDIILEEGGINVPLNNLSDGYLSTASWVGDLVRRLVEAFPNEPDPLKAEGVVLVDEIDIHLHPKWQRSIVETVRNLFPNLQFIVTSHSPFIAQDMTQNDKIIVLEKNAGKVTATQDSESVQGWRVDQILTSYLFDLETTRNMSITVAEDEYQNLLDLQQTSKLSKNDTNRLQELRTWLRHNKSHPGETIAENELYDTAEMFLDLLSQQIKE
ncbi:MAG: AAA family ATPase [Chloroflexi bacterium]|nr:AAA family ATPase [Chloroflexota bacterium]